MSGLLSLLFRDNILICAAAKCTEMASIYTKVVKRKKKTKATREFKCVGFHGDLIFPPRALH